MSLLKYIKLSNVCYRQKLLTTSSLLGIHRFASSSKVPEESKINDWVSVYKFQYIRGLASLNKLKAYQVVGTLVAIPGNSFNNFQPTQFLIF